MASAQLGTAVTDGGLDVLYSAATTIVICSDEPTTFNEANTTFKLGAKAFGAGNCFTAIEDVLDPGLVGRKVASVAVSDGAVSLTGTATHFAVIDGSRLLLRGLLSSAQDVVSPQTFTLSSFDVILDILSP